MTIGKTIALIRWTFVGKVMSLLFNMLSRFAIAFLPRSKYLLISWLHSPSADFGAQENKVCHCFQCFPIYSSWSDGTGCHDLCFWMLKFKPAFSLSSFTFIKRLFCSSSLSAIRVVSAYLRLLYFSWQSWFQLVLHPTHPVLCNMPQSIFFILFYTIYTLLYTLFFILIYFSFYS